MPTDDNQWHAITVRDETNPSELRALNSQGKRIASFEQHIKDLQDNLDTTDATLVSMRTQARHKDLVRFVITTIPTLGVMVVNLVGVEVSEVIWALAAAVMVPQIPEILYYIMEYLEPEKN